MKHIYLLLFCMVFLPFMTRAQVYTLEECLTAALEKNNKIKNSLLEMEMARQTRKEAFTFYFPQVSASGMAFQGSRNLLQADLDLFGIANVPLSFIKKGVFATATAVQPVFAGLQIINGNKLAKLGEDVSVLQHRLTENEVKQKTVEYYWLIATLNNNLSTLDVVDKLLTEIYRQVELAVKTGLTTRNDLLRVELRQQEIASQRLRVENGLRVSKMVLAQYIGADFTSFDIATDEFVQPEPPLGYYIAPQDAVQQRIEYLLAQKNVDAQGYQIRMERSKHLPQIGIGVGHVYYNILKKDVNTELACASVSVPISSWWGGSHVIKKARVKKEQAENDRKNAEELLMVEIEQLWSELTEAYAQIELARKSIASSTENLRLNKQHFSAGTSSLSDLLNAETLYTESCNNYTSACAEYQTKLSNYLTHTRP